MANASVGDIRACYELILGRAASAQDEVHWLREIADRGLSPADLGPLFVSSEEFRVKNPKIFVDDDVELSQHLSRVDINGVRYWLKASEPMYQTAISTGVHLPHLVRLMGPLLRGGGVLVDVGANVGVLTLQVWKSAEDAGKLILIEPFPANVKNIVINCAENGIENCIVYPFAASNEFGMAIAPRRLSTNKMISAGQLTAENADSYMLFSCAPLDALLDKEPRIDLVRMDIEGHEAFALEGATRVISKHRPVFVVEHFPELCGDPSYDTKAVIRYFREHGYTGRVVDRSGELFDVGVDGLGVDEFMAARSLRWCDILWVPAEKAQIIRDIHISAIPTGGKQAKAEYDLGSEINFRAGGNSQTYVVEGFAGVEDWGTWTLGERASIAMMFREHPQSDLDLIVAAVPFLHGTHSRLRVEILLNDVAVGQWSFAKNAVDQCQMRVPASLVGADGHVTIAFVIDAPRSPEEVGLSALDPRKLGLGILSLRMLPAEA